MTKTTSKGYAHLPTDKTTVASRTATHGSVITHQLLSVKSAQDASSKISPVSRSTLPTGDHEDCQSKRVMKPADAHAYLISPGKQWPTWPKDMNVDEEFIPMRYSFLETNLSESHPSVHYDRRAAGRFSMTIESILPRVPPTNRSVEHDSNRADCRSCPPSEQ